MSRLFAVAVLVASLTTSVSFAWDNCYYSACDPCEQAFCSPCGPIGCGSGTGSLLDKFTLYGWVQSGLTVNNHGSRNTYNGASTPLDRSLDAFSGNSYLLMSRHPSDLSVYQTWLGLMKGCDTSRGFDWGFQTDLLFGTDGRYGQCFGDQTFDHGWGSGDYNLSLMQIYGTVGYRNMKVRVGKFASGMSHEALPAVATFFNTAAFNCFNMPLHVSGAMVDYTVSKNLTVSGGWVAGQQNSFENRFGDNAFLGNVTLTPWDRLKVTYNLYCGWTHGLDRVPDAATRFGRNYHTGTEIAQSLIFTVNLNKKWMYMIEGVLADNSYDTGTTKAYYTGLNQHLIYTINNAWAAGLRFEWSHAKGTIFDVANQTFDGYDSCAITLGANWTPNKWFILRPELRYDWTDYNNGFQPFASGTKANQLSGGGSVIVKF